MMSIIQYIQDHTQRGECQCGLCRDHDGNPEPKGHTADLVFFKMAAVNYPSADDFKRLTKEHPGDFSNCDPFDGAEHSYLELGGWIGDQGAAMLYMGLGHILGLFDLLTPKTIMGLDGALAMEMAGMGYVSIKASAVVVPA